MKGVKLSFNRRISSKDSDDFFPTPHWAVQALLVYEKFQGEIFEPACGTGNISEVLLKNHYKVLSNDIVDRGYGDKHEDFLKTNLIEPMNLCFTLLSLHEIRWPCYYVCLF